ncbi:MAG: heterodisulfide reductase subunit B [Desulforudis sp.]|jgi:heterodisulfide reductase subunit B|nr:CoB--CoM heterodisulfide reductase iron-sulfur subunit B family protein [Clostridia bacterium]MDQ7792628.1 CoB--CoM heterodisulfide reductase iron-sulfur subunit B family protein [Clostridia bacterium]RJX18866.1 MAG: heterodisulfide reductase subunit B [Desulforudis sp.]
MITRLSYYPGCSLKATGLEYDLSARAVCRELDVELTEVEDWNCCGATSAHSLNSFLGLSLPARNLAQVQKGGLDVVAPCAACYNRLRHAEYHLRRHGRMGTLLEKSLGFVFEDRVTVLTLPDLFVRRVGLETVLHRVTNKLNGLRLACFYGCLLVRPPRITGAIGQARDPDLLDRLVASLGAEPVQWSYKTECCGASQALTHPEVARAMVSRLLEAAREAGAEAVVTACPLCQSNLEMHGSTETGLPSFYFTELMGLAFNLPEAQRWFKMHLVDPTRCLACCRGSASTLLECK